MKEMLMLLSASMTKKEIIERLTESCAQYNEANLLHNEESIKTAEQELFLMSNLLIMNTVTNGDMKKAIDSIKTMGEIEKAHNFFQTPKN